MESHAKSNRAERDRRKCPFKAWKRIRLKLNPLIVVFFIFTLLIFVKLIISGMYLSFDFTPFAGADIALADEEDQEIDPELDKMKRMLRVREEKLLILINDMWDIIDDNAYLIIDLRIDEIEEKYKELEPQILKILKRIKEASHERD